MLERAACKVSGSHLPSAPYNRNMVQTVYEMDDRPSCLRYPRGSALGVEKLNDLFGYGPPLTHPPLTSPPTRHRTYPQPHYRQLPHPRPPRRPPPPRPRGGAGEGRGAAHRQGPHHQDHA